LTPAQSASFGDAPRALDKAAPGEEVGGCYVGPETGAWVTCQRFDYLEAGKGGALLVIEGEQIGVRRGEALEPELPSPVAPASPLLKPLLRHFPQTVGPSTVSWRDGLVAFGGGRYAFEVPLHPGDELRVALGLYPRTPLTPARFVV